MLKTIAVNVSLEQDIIDQITQEKGYLEKI